MHYLQISQGLFGPCWSAQTIYQSVFCAPVFMSCCSSEGCLSHSQRGALSHIFFDCSHAPDGSCNHANVHSMPTLGQITFLPAGSRCICTANSKTLLPDIHISTSRFTLTAMVAACHFARYAEPRLPCPSRGPKQTSPRGSCMLLEAPACLLSCKRCVACGRPSDAESKPFGPA